MPVYETFSRRRDQAAKVGEPEIYIYDEMPEALINQIIMIWSDALPEGRDFRMGKNINASLL